ncbi:hypothetical protein [Bacillus sp. MMSF_3328]|uniref:hypothetical protein n=1 Tax=Bacillus sp. MMSF_3328 TaxID=3047080 RepID=UPI00273EFFC4|nr:hypothetical protein [Bacillus sp. MMSF_3328]
MKKEEIIEYADNINLRLTDSIFRNYVQLGLLRSVKKSLGYKNGVYTEYPEDSTEIIQQIKKYKEIRIPQKEFIFLLFAEGYKINYRKLKQGLAVTQEKTLRDMKYLKTKIEDKHTYDWAINTYLEKEIKFGIAGRPSSEQKIIIESKKEQENLKFNLAFRFIADFFDQEDITYSANSLFQSLGYEKSFLKINFPQKWLSTNQWVVEINNSSEKDLQEVQQLFILIKYYYKYFTTNSKESKVYKSYISQLETVYKNAGFGNFFLDYELIKLLITLMIIAPDWRRKLIQFLSLDGNIKSYEHLEQWIPILLMTIDKVLKNEEELKNK